MVHDMYFVQVKTPAESNGPWDYYKILSTIPGDKAFRPLERRRMSTWSNSDERMCRYVCPPILMKEVMTHAELDDQWSELFR